MPLTTEPSFHEVSALLCLVEADRGNVQKLLGKLDWRAQQVRKRDLVPWHGGREEADQTYHSCVFKIKEHVSAA